MKSVPAYLVALSLILTACSGQAVATSSPLTLASTALSPTQAMQVGSEVPLEQQPIVVQAVGQFVNANGGRVIINGVDFDSARLLAQIQANPKTFIQKWIIKGVEQEILVVPQPNPTSSEKIVYIPLAMMGERGGWKSLGFKDISPGNFIIGSGVDTWTGNFDDPSYKPLFLSQFNLGTNDGTLAQDFYSRIPLKKLTPAEVVSYYKWDGHKAVEGFFQVNKFPTGILNVFTNSLFTTDNAPEWIRQFSDTELIEWMSRHLKAIAANTPNQNIKYVEVINEMFWHNPKTGWAGADGDYLYSRLGDNYVKTAYTEAKKIWPNAELIFNQDTASEGIQTNIILNSGALAEYNYVKKMVAQGVPIDGFGLENHLQARDFNIGDVDKNFSEYKAQLSKYIKMYGAIGVKFYITEMDVNTGGLPDSMTTAQKEELKAALFSAAYDVCLSEENCKGAIMQSFADASSWLYDPNYPWKPGGPGLPFDKNYNPVLAYYSLLGSLLDANSTRK